MYRNRGSNNLAAVRKMPVEKVMIALIVKIALLLVFGFV